jgi:hypothetical protein
MHSQDVEAAASLAKRLEEIKAAKAAAEAPAEGAGGGDAAAAAAAAALPPGLKVSWH